MDCFYFFLCRVSFALTYIDTRDYIKGLMDLKKNLRVSTSGAGWSNWAAESLLTKPHKLRTDDSATARHEHEAKRNANEHRENFYSLLHERCRMEQLGGWELAHKAAKNYGVYIYVK